MLTYNTNGTVGFSLFSQFPELICTFSTRHLGDLNVGERPLSNANKLLSLYNISLQNFVAMGQIHGINIKKVNKSQGAKMLAATDGIVSDQLNLFLGVKCADCLPVFFYDPKIHAVAVLHAGWKGVLNGIIPKMISFMKRYQSAPENVYVAIGPHIGPCCYKVSGEMIHNFKDKLKGNVSFNKKSAGWYLDIGVTALQQLFRNGIMKSHVDLTDNCTFCKSDLFFSYRRDAVGMYGEMLGIIGMKENYGFK